MTFFNSIAFCKQGIQNECLQGRVLGSSRYLPYSIQNAHCISSSTLSSSDSADAIAVPRKAHDGSLSLISDVQLFMTVIRTDQSTAHFIILYCMTRNACSSSMAYSYNCLSYLLMGWDQCILLVSNHCAVDIAKLTGTVWATTFNFHLQVAKSGTLEIASMRSVYIQYKPSLWIVCYWGCAKLILHEKASGVHTKGLIH